MSEDETSLEYCPVNKTFKDYFKPMSKLPLQGIKSFLYGGCSSTFKNHSESNLKLIEKVCNRKVIVSSRKISQGYTMRLKDKKNEFPEAEI